MLLGTIGVLVLLAFAAGVILFGLWAEKHDQQHRTPGTSTSR